MATETPDADPPDAPDTFEDIDWDADRGAVEITRTKVALWLSSLVLAGVFVYDYFVLPVGTPTISVGIEGTPLAEAFGSEYVWNVTQLDWLFILTLLAMVFYVVVPLYQNQRLTAYYWKEFKKNKLAVASIIYLIVIFAIGTIGPIFLAKPELELLAQYQPPVYTSVPTETPIQCLGRTAGGMCHGTWQHPFGTTSQGKDILILLVYGMQVSMKVGLISALIVITIGTTVGTVAAYGGGWVDEILMRYVDIQLVFPAFFLYLLLNYLFGGSLFMFIMIFGLTGWGGIARLVRSEALQRAEEEYIMAANSAGASTFYVIRRHLVPNVSNTVITAVTLIIPGFILFEAALSFLQLGDPSVPSWGQVIAAGRSDLSTAWWISTFPGVLLFTTILAFNFMGDALRDALDPRSEA